MAKRIDIEELGVLVAESETFSDVIRARGKVPTGSNITHMKNMCARYGIDTSHMTGQSHNRGKVSRTRKNPDDILIEGKPTDIRVNVYYLRRSMLERSVPYVCNECGQDDNWHGRKLQLQVDHKDGRYWNNKLDNLQFLCPHCHCIKTLSESRARNNKPL